MKLNGVYNEILNRFQAGIYPGTARLAVQCSSHSATMAPTAIKND